MKKKKNFFNMNILGIDFGTKNIGLAWCDTDINIVLPFGVVHSLEELVRVVKEEKLDKIVVGLPIGVGGSGTTNIERVKKFAENLKKQVDTPIDFCDERFSSHEADTMGGEASRDEKSAMIILQSYLDNQNRK